VRGGSILHRESIPILEHICRPGLDVYRYADEVDLIPSLDASSDSEIFSLSVGESVLINLLGERESAQLLAGLDLRDNPSIRLHQTPLPISAILHGSLRPSLKGAALNIHCQARCLEYLSALYQFVAKPSGVIQPQGQRERVSELHDYLLILEGKLPTLDELARRFGRSARALNQDFKNEYGASIHGFINDQRLLQAHRAITHTGVPLKVIAANLGYSHVNHFNAAFKKKFGYPPGRLRKGKLKTSKAPPRLVQDSASGPSVI
jgi:AraC-like DNA-binding protein